MVTRCMITSFISNIFLTALKLIFGLISKSKTLIADGVHSLSDTATDIIGIVGAKIASKKPDRNHPYGHGKAEYLTSIFISLLILYLGYEIFKNSFTKSNNNISYYLLIISVVTITIKFIISSYLIKKGKKLGSNILITSGTESRYDCLSGTIAFIFLLLQNLSNKIAILKYADTIGSIVISIMTIKIGVKILIENVKSAIGEVDLDKNKINEVKYILNSYKEIKNIKRITILKYGSYSNLILDLEFNQTLQLKKLYIIETKIKKELREKEESYKYITVNILPYIKQKKSD